MRLGSTSRRGPHSWTSTTRPGYFAKHEGACRLLADGVDIRTIQLMLGHSDIKTTQRYLNITDEEVRKAMTGMWERRRQLRAAGA